MIADRTAIRRLVLKGAGTPYDSLTSPFEYKNMAFTKLRSVCKQRTHNEFLDTDYESWGIINENGELTNAGALIADESQFVILVYSVPDGMVSQRLRD